MALVIAPLVILGYAAGLPFGPVGVAFGYSAMMLLLTVPMIVWATHGLVISWREVLETVKTPWLSAMLAAAISLGATYSFGQLLGPLQRLTFAAVLLLASYSWFLLYVMGQRTFYFDLVRELRGVFERPSTAGLKLDNTRSMSG
jgi:hypothetical protein